jgi:drug/metabolite transporter (DMT)-like permease
MARSYPAMLLALASIWGASYLFIKVAIDEIEPAPMMFFRLAISAALLVPFLLVVHGARRGTEELRDAWRPGVVLGIINGAVPFTLIAWGEKHIDSGVAAIANSTVPLFVVLLAIRFRPSERITGSKLSGVLLGLVGVAILAGAQPGGGAWAVAGTLAVVAASLSYAVSGIYGASLTDTRSGPVLAAASMLAGAVVLLPFALLQLPDAVPGWEVIASVLALAVGGTAAAQLVLYRMLRLFGSSRTSLVTYLMPLFALAYGVLLLDEPLTIAALIGLALILPGVALGSGAAPSLRRAAPTPVPRP